MLQKRFSVGVTAGLNKAKESYPYIFQSGDATDENFDHFCAFYRSNRNDVNVTGMTLSNSDDIGSVLIY